MEHLYEKYCMHCGASIDKDAMFCPKCGTKQTNTAANSRNINTEGDKIGDVSKDWLITLLLCFFVGTLGVHGFYNGKIGTGILMLITLGGFGIWYLIDLIFIIVGRFTDKNGKEITIKGTQY